jgi:hypothetical protein
MRVEPIDPEPMFNHPALDGARDRIHLYATAGVELAERFYLGLLGGYQLLPEDSTNTNDRTPNLITRWPRSSGWQAGAELGFFGRLFEHHLTASYGRDDVELGWGTPDLVYRDDPAARRALLSRAGSSLLQAVYWGGLSVGRLQVMGGAWGQWRRPAKMERTWNVLSDISQQVEPVLARTADFRALKLNLVTLYRVGPIAAGLRLDGIRYFDKSATSNTIEPLADEALRPFTRTDPSGAITERVQGPSRWEREAVDCGIVSPFVELGVAEVFRLRAAWSGAWYSAAIHRQRQDADFHANFTLSAWLVYRFGVN